MVMSPEYLLFSTERVFVRRLGRMPISESTCIRCMISSFARLPKRLDQVELDVVGMSVWEDVRLVFPSSFARKGTT